jgi:predicted phosphodiesterase
MLAPGRSCPTSYYYGARELRATPSLEVETLWLAGGLYGNPFALDALIEAYEREAGAKALVFNGDFHWFDVDPGDHARVHKVVLAHHATRGNVETELAMPQAGAGCGCGYPDWVGDETVRRSNRILERLRATAERLPHTLAPLRALPMHLTARIGDARVAVVHGDAESLAGWGFSQEALATGEGMEQARAAFDAAGVDIFACSHTCLPVLQRFGGERFVVNNGAAGMPNFRANRYGLATRIALAPAHESVYGMRRGALHIEAVPLRYDHAAWERRFLEQWPPGSDAHASYCQRIVAGPNYEFGDAARTAN